MTLRLEKLFTAVIAVALGFSFVTANAAPTDTELFTFPKLMTTRWMLKSWSPALIFRRRFFLLESRHFTVAKINGSLERLKPLAKPVFLPVNTMTHDTQRLLLLMWELVFAWRAKNPETFKRWLVDGIQDHGKPAVEELMISWLNPLMSRDMADKTVGWQLGVRL